MFHGVLGGLPLNLLIQKPFREMQCYSLVNYVNNLVDYWISEKIGLNLKKNQTTEVYTGE